MKGFIYWLLGDRAGSVVVAGWSWLWGQPIKQGGAIAVAVGENAVEQKAQKVSELATTLANTKAKLSIFEEKKAAIVNEIRRLKTAAERSSGDQKTKLLHEAVAKKQGLDPLSEGIDRMRDVIKDLNQALLAQEQELITMETAQEYSSMQSEIGSVLKSLGTIKQQYGVDNISKDFTASTTATNELFSTEVEKLKMASNSDTSMLLMPATDEELLSKLDDI
jgi:hypothetical protein